MLSNVGSFMQATAGPDQVAQHGVEQVKCWQWAYA